MQVFAETNEIVTTALAIARAANVDSRGTGRPCRLRDSFAVRTFLAALLDGRSLTAAGVAAGFSEGVVRRWLRLGSAAGARGAYADLAAAVAAIPEARRATQEAKRLAAVPTTPTPPRSPSLPPVPLLQIHRWKALIDRASSYRCGGEMAQIEAGHLIQQVDQEMLEYGVSRATLPMPAALPKLMLPRNLRYEQIQTRYIAWCNATGRPGPTDMQVEMEGMRWYREHVAPEKPDGD